MTRTRYLLIVLGAAPGGLLLGALLTTQCAGSAELAPPRAASVAGSVATSRPGQETPAVTASGQPDLARFHPPAPSSAQNAAFTGAVFTDLTGAGPAATDFSRWTAALAGGASRAALVGAVVGSRAWFAHEVGTQYQRLLGRPAETNAADGWAPLLATSQPTLRLETALAGSQEYFVRHGSDDSAWLGSVCADLLGRPPAQTETDFEREALRSGATREQVAATLVASAEAGRHFVDGLFQQYLGRAATPAELTWLVPAAGDAWQENAIRAALVESDEYFTMHTRP